MNYNLKTKIMFKTLFGTALAAVSVEALDTASAQCASLTSSSLTIWNISDLMNDDYLSATLSNGQTINWNYCRKQKYDSNSNTESFAVAKTTYTKVIADSFYEDITNLRDSEENNKTTGVTFVQTSDTLCKNKIGDVAAANFSFKTNLYCDESVTENGAPTIVSSTYEDCVYEVTLKHKTGCPTVGIDTDAYLNWFADNEWAIGIIYIIAGPLIALFGTAYFPYVVASLVAIFTIGLVLGMSLAFGWMLTTGGTWACISVALVLGIVAGCVVRRNIWIMIGLVGLIAGFFSGALVYAMIYGISGWKAVWGYWLISIVMAGLGCVAACYLGKSVVLVSTSLTGSYLFMRSWTLFFPGHYPSEAELVDDYSNLELDDTFWIFIGIWVFCFVCSAIFQCKHAKTHSDLDNYQKN